MEKKKPQLEVQKYVEEKSLTGKDKYIVKAVDLPVKKLAWMLKDKSSTINNVYNK